MSDLNTDLRNLAAGLGDAPMRLPEEVRRRGEHRHTVRRVVVAGITAALLVPAAVAFGDRGSDVDPAGTDAACSPTTNTTQFTTPYRDRFQPGRDNWQIVDVGDIEKRTLDAVAARDDGFVIAASHSPRAYVPARDLVPLWSSADGIHWTEGRVVGGAAPLAVHDVIATTDRYLAAGEDVDWHPAIWSSSDGHTWHPVRGLGSIGTDGEIWDIAGTGAGFIAKVGNELAISDDGCTWRPAGPGARVAGHRISALTGGGEQFVGVDGLVPTRWSSPDGRTWHARSLDENREWTRRMAAHFYYARGAVGVVKVGGWPLRHEDELAGRIAFWSAARAP